MDDACGILLYSHQLLYMKIILENLGYYSKTNYICIILNHIQSKLYETSKIF